MTFPSAHVLTLMSLTVIWARSEDIWIYVTKTTVLERKEQQEYIYWQESHSSISTNETDQL